jgi:hypothetical protein
VKDTLAFEQAARLLSIDKSAVISVRQETQDGTASREIAIFGKREMNSLIKAALQTFVETINKNGGLITGMTVTPPAEPVGEPEFSPIGAAYLAACAALDVEPVFDRQEEEDPER